MDISPNFRENTGFDALAKIIAEHHKRKQDNAYRMNSDSQIPHDNPSSLHLPPEVDRDQ